MTVPQKISMRELHHGTILAPVSLRERLPDRKWLHAARAVDSPALGDRIGHLLGDLDVRDVHLDRQRDKAVVDLYFEFLLVLLLTNERETDKTDIPR